MKMATVALALTLAAPLGAQSFEVGLFVGQQQYPSPRVDVAPGSTLQMEPDNKTVFAARFGYSVAQFGPASFQVTAGFQPDAKSTVKGTLTGYPTADIGEFKQSHWSVGAMFNFKAFVAVGAGLELRSERLSGTLAGTTESTTYSRAWARLNAGIAIPSPVVKPFLGLEVAFPLSTQSLSLNSSNSDVMKSLAAKSQFGLYAGIRF
jgi:hypothetical protein